jgi:CubicO group peptidase (beta-lactamase class C family)
MRMTMSKIAMFLVVVLTSFSCRSLGPGDDLSLETALDERLKAWEAVGGSGVVLVKMRGSILFRRGYGYADREAGIRNTPSTPYDIGSLVKEMTFLGIYQLDEKGLLNVEDQLGEHFEDVPSDKQHIRLVDILTHTSGLQDMVDGDLQPIEFTPEVDRILITREQLLRRSLAAPLVDVPEGEEVYSNFGFGLLAVIIEKVSGLSYEQYIAQNIFDPAGMTRTGYLIPGYQSENVAVGYIDGQRWGTTLDWDWPDDGPSWILRGSGGMYSDAVDFVKLFDALAAGKLVGDKGVDAYHDYFSDRFKSGDPYAMSFGANDVFEAGYFWAPSQGVVIVVFSNESQHPASSVIGAVWSVVRSNS